MNAYELAEMVRNEPFHTNLNRNTIADFICQQADRIAELEKELNECPHGVDDGACKECYQEQTKPLSDEEIEKIGKKYGIESVYRFAYYEFARAIEERHGIK